MYSTKDPGTCRLFGQLWQTLRNTNLKSYIITEASGCHKCNWSISEFIVPNVITSAVRSVQEITH